MTARLTGLSLIGGANATGTVSEETALPTASAATPVAITGSATVSGTGKGPVRSTAPEVADAGSSRAGEPSDGPALPAVPPGGAVVTAQTAQSKNETA